MRQFSVDAPEFFCFQIEGSKKVHKIPLGTSMTNAEIIAFDNTEGDYEKQVDWLRSYIGDVVDKLTASVTGDIIRAWADESKKQGTTVGESSASSD